MLHTYKRSQVCFSENNIKVNDPPGPYGRGTPTSIVLGAPGTGDFLKNGTKSLPKFSSKSLRTGVLPGVISDSLISDIHMVLWANAVIVVKFVKSILRYIPAF